VSNVGGQDAAAKAKLQSASTGLFPALGPGAGRARSTGNNRP